MTRKSAVTYNGNPQGAVLVSNVNENRLQDPPQGH